MADLATYVVEPRAPLVFRSGKPFRAGTRDGVHWPWPSAWAGLMRTQTMIRNGYKSDRGGDRYQLSDEDSQKLLNLETRGCFLARSSEGRLDLYLPRPADAVGIRNPKDGEISLKRLVPLALGDGVGTDLPPGLVPLRFQGAESIKDKAVPLAPFWPAADFERWILGEPTLPPSGPTLATEVRTHVAIESTTLAARDGQLFQTDGLDLGPQRAQSGFDSGHWVIAGQGPDGLKEGLVVFGGERRLSQLSQSRGHDLFSIPARWAAELAPAASCFAITLATPALFSEGWVPGWLRQDSNSLIGRFPGIDGEVRLVAARIDRWEPISGWDLHRQQPRGSRRAVPAGSTYWFEATKGPLDLKKLWLRSMCDNPQDRRDGFGLALPRPWYRD